MKHDWKRFLTTRNYLILLILGGLIYFSPIILTQNTIWPSEFDHYVPDLHIILKGWSNLEPPLWTDLQWNGFPHHAVLHNPTWYPPIILLGILGFDAFVSAKILLITHFILGMVGMFLLARKYVNEHYTLLAGFIFGFNPVTLHFVNSGWLTFLMGLAWLPLFFLFWFHTENVWKKAAFSGLMLALMLHSGGIFILYYAVLFTALIEIIQAIMEKNYKRLLIFAAVIVVFFALTFFKILPGLEYSKTTFRTVPLAYEEFLAGKVNILDLPGKTIGFGVIISLIAMAMSFMKKRWFAINIAIIALLLLSFGWIFLKPVYSFLPFFKTQSANLDRVLYPIIPFLILIPLQFIQDRKFRSRNTRYLLIAIMVLTMILSFRPLHLGDYKGELDQNQALQFIAQDKTCCWRAWQIEERGLDSTLNAYTTPLDIRTLFGFMGSRFFNVTYLLEMSYDLQDPNNFLKKYDIKYLLSKEPFETPPTGYKLVQKFPDSPAFRPHMSGQYVYVRENSTARKP